MAVCYDKLFHRMIDKRITNAQLMSMAGFSPNIITRLKRNEYISLESIEKICHLVYAVDKFHEVDGVARPKKAGGGFCCVVGGY